MNSMAAWSDQGNVKQTVACSGSSAHGVKAEALKVCSRAAFPTRHVPLGHQEELCTFSAPPHI